ncbi:hypothetical protein ACWD4F_17405 [Streptomyces aureus]
MSAVSSPRDENEVFQQWQVDLEQAKAARHPDPAALEILRRLRGELRQVMDRSEEHDLALFDRADELLDEVGGLLRRGYPKACTMAYRDGVYYRECPVDLGHLRVGFSVETRVDESECSICGLDPDECDHVPGASYEGRECLVIITKAQILAVTLVANPRFRNARFRSLSLGTSTELRAALGPNFRPGVRLSCDKCLAGCHGLNRNFGGSTHG